MGRPHLVTMYWTDRIMTKRNRKTAVILGVEILALVIYTAPVSTPGHSQSSRELCIKLLAIPSFHGSSNLLGIVCSGTRLRSTTMILLPG